MISSAKEAYESGRMEECRRILMDALNAFPEDAEARDFASRVFPEILQAMDEVDRIEVDAWSGPDVLDADWARAGGGGVSSGKAEAFEMAPPDGFVTDMEEPPVADWADSFEPPPAPGLELLCRPPESPADPGVEPEAEDAIGDSDEPPAHEVVSDEVEAAASAEAERAALEAEEVASLLEGAAELFELADFSGSLELVEKALEIRPKDPTALDYLAKNQDTLIHMYESKLGRMDRRPNLAIAPDEVVWLNLDHRAGYVLSQIDGTVTVEDIYALSGMSRLDTSRILAQLIEEGVVSFD